MDTWILRNPLPTVNSLSAVTYGNGQFVAVGDLGTIVTSSDGVNWVTRQSGTTNRLAAITYGNGQFVAVGGNHTFWDVGRDLPMEPTTILTSTDGLNWVRQRSPMAQSCFFSIAYGNGRFVAVGSEFNGFLTSTNGVDWIEPETLAPAIAIAYGNGQFVAVGDSYFGDALVTSMDGVHWIEHPSGIHQLVAIAYGNGRFVASGFDPNNPNSGTFATSVDGVTWFPQQSPITNVLNGVTYGDGQFVAVGDWPMVTSTDGTNWVQRQAPTDGLGLDGVTYGNGLFVAVGFAGLILTSADGVNWIRQSGTSARLNAIAYGNGRFVALGSDQSLNSQNFIVTSTDGANWTRQLTTTNIHFLSSFSSSIAYGRGQFVWVGDRGTILISSDGTNWQPSSSGTTNDLQAIAFAGDRFVAVGWEANTLLTSTNAIDWDQLKLPPFFGGNNGFSMAYGNNRFVMVGWGLTATSTNGVDWVQQRLPIDGYPANSIAFGNGKFVLVGGSMIGWPQPPVLTSMDGVNWTIQHGTGSSLSTVFSVAFGGGLFVAVGGWDLGENTRIIMTSADGVQWDRQEPLSSSLWSVAYGGNHFVAVGNFETILESGPIITLDITPDLPSGRLQLSLSGPTGSSYTIQTSTDLISWQNLTNFTSCQSTTTILANLPAAASHTFFRAEAQ